MATTEKATCPHCDKVFELPYPCPDGVRYMCDSDERELEFEVDVKAAEERAKNSYDNQMVQNTMSCGIGVQVIIIGPRKQVTELEARIAGVM